MNSSKAISNRISVYLTVLFLVAQLPNSQAATNVTATAQEVNDFLGGRSGRLVYIDKNENDKVYWIDLSDMSVSELSGDIGTSEPLISPDGTRVVYGINNIISKWPGESSNNEGDSYVRFFSGGSRTHVAGSSVAGKQAFSPHWWVDPGNGDEYIVYMDYYEKDTQASSGRATWKQLIVDNQPVGNPIKILDHAFDGGLSKDGTRVGEAYHYLHMAHTIDLGGGNGSAISSRMDGGNQCCNASMSPDNNYYIMHLRIDHEGCNVRDESDSLVTTIYKPSGAAEMQNPEYSTHSNYSTFTAEFGSNYYIYIANVSSGASLKIAEGNFAVPHLWIASQTPVMSLAPASLTFNAVAGGNNPTAQTISVSNTGQGQLDQVSITENAAWLSVNVSGSGNDQTLTNEIDITGLVQDSYTTTVEVTCNNASNSPQIYTVNLEVVAGGDNVDPEILIETPTESQTISGSTPVSGTASDNVGLEKIELQIDDGPFELASGTSNWTYSLITTSLDDGSHSLTARATDTSGNSATDSVNVNVDNSSTEPSITIIAPNGGEVWEVGTTQHIRWSTVGIEDVTLRYSTDDGQNWDMVEITVDKSKPEWLDYPWIIPDQPSKDCRVHISGYFGEVPTQSADSFEIKAAGTGQDDEVIVSGGCSCSSSAKPKVVPLVFLLAIGTYLRRRKIY
jgi:Big-like domain-containing protein